jgi:drug/metabolite transporter (DMT)-like permease
LPLQAFFLVVLASFAHSTWNILLKRATDTKHLLLFSSVLEALLFIPAAVYGLTESWLVLGWKTWLLLLATGVLHLLYSESLLRGYKASDLSVVYPLARGTGPLLSFIGAILLLHEHLSLLGAGGALLITFGILFLSGGIGALRRRLDRVGLFWGFATGLTIACYTLVDGYSIRVLLVSPFLVEYAGNAFRALLLSIGALRQPPASLAAEYRKSWKSAFGIAVLMPLGYVLVLFAMQIAPVSHVAPVREMSMMIGAYFGVSFLGEGNARRRLFGSVIIALGVTAIAIG